MGRHSSCVCVESGSVGDIDLATLPLLHNTVVVPNRYCRDGPLALPPSCVFVFSSKLCGMSEQRRQMESRKRIEWVQRAT